MTAKYFRGYACNCIVIFRNPNQSKIIRQAIHMVLLMNWMIYDIIMRPIFPDINPY